MTPDLRVKDHVWVPSSFSVGSGIASARSGSNWVESPGTKRTRPLKTMSTIARSCVPDAKCGSRVPMSAALMARRRTCPSSWALRRTLLSAVEPATPRAASWVNVRRESGMRFLLNFPVAGYEDEQPTYMSLVLDVSTEPACSLTHGHRASCVPKDHVTPVGWDVAHGWRPGGSWILCA